MHLFHRTDLARQMADVILNEAVGSAAPSGLFLAALRRTGKSTFLREDLRPELGRRGAVVIYADLWADRQADPGEVILGAVREALAQHDGVVLRLAKAAGMEKLALKGFTFSLDRVGLGKDIPLSAALAALSDEVQAPLVLIIDEAQHAITTDKGSDALFALKAARDELNSSRHHGLRIVATGSNRDKLAMLRSSKEQAFFGAPLVAFPPLGRDYIDWFCRGVALQGPLNAVEVMALFVRAAHRPELLGAAADHVRLQFGLDPADVPAQFEQAVDAQIAAMDAQTLRVVHSLTALQSTVLRVMAAHGATYAPFEARTMEAYRAVLAQLDPNGSVTPDTANVQQALLALQEKSLAWKERRGVYALEEQALAGVMAQAGMLASVPPR